MYKTSTVALKVVESNQKGARCLGVQLGHPVSGSIKRSGPPGWRSVVRQVYMIMNPVEL
jgi:hypothetical protein